jgi:manganese/zinc/iron transport system substrate-binding protein
LAQINEQKRFLVTSHDAFNYFTRAYLATDAERQTGEWQKRFAAPEGLAPDSQLSPIDIQFIIDHLMKYEIRILFPESNLSKDSIRKIISAGREKGLDLKIADVSLYGDAMGAPGSTGDNYLKMIVHDAEALVQKLTDG